MLDHAPLPVFWLFGKTGSGKTSVVRFLTGAETAEIGNGFRPRTTRSNGYDFPSAGEPVLRFLDTRGLGEIAYDPSEDLEAFDRLAHVMLVTVRLMDQALGDVLTPLRRMRAANPRRPVILVLTALHEAYPGEQHPDPDPFDDSDHPHGLDPRVQECIDRQRERFRGLFDRVVPVDLTVAEEGFNESCFGGERLRAALFEALPAAYRQTFVQLDTALCSLRDLNQRRALPYIVSYSTMAATAAAVPVPWIDMPVVSAIQSHLVVQLARLYGQRVSPALLGKIAGAIGGRILLRMAAREALKAVPGIGAAANAAMAWVYTYALGRFCCWYFGEIGAGNTPSNEDIQRVWGRAAGPGRQALEEERTGARPVSGARAIWIAILLFVPPLVFAVIGAWALWSTGVLLYTWWVLPLCWGLAYLLARRRQPDRGAASEAGDAPPLHWTPQDRAAIEIIRRKQQEAQELPIERLTEPRFYLDQALELGAEIARHYHPKRQDPFSAPTAPEIVAAARLCFEDLEHRLDDYVPGSHLLTINQYRLLARSPAWLRTASRAAWAASALVNPLNIARYLSAEATITPFTRQLKSNVLISFYLVFLREVGFYAIEMNSGRLRVGADRYRLAREGAPPSARETAAAVAATGPKGPTAEPARQEITIVLLGQVHAGKSSVARALAGGQPLTDEDESDESVHRFRLGRREDGEQLVLVDTRGYREEGATPREQQIADLACERADLVLLVMDVHNAARRGDAEMLRRIGAWFDERPDRRSPPVLGVLTHIDTLTPAMEWSPPYDWQEPTTVKERRMREAVEYCREALGSSLAGAVPVCTDWERGAVYGVDEWLVPAMCSLLDEARACAMLRTLRRDLGGDAVSKVMGQMRRAGAALLKAAVRP